MIKVRLKVRVTSWVQVDMITASLEATSSINQTAEFSLVVTGYLIFTENVFL